MFDALSIGATGMQAQQLSVETIANNLANVNTAGFKKGRVSFSDLMARESIATDDPKTAAARAAGVAVSNVSRVFDPGELKKTDSQFDLAVQGEGFLEVALPDGTSAFTRGGTLKVNAQGLLATASGHPLKPAIAIPDNIDALRVAPDGRVHVRVAGQAQFVEAGQLELARFGGSAALSVLGDNLYKANGDAAYFRPGADSAATLAQGYLEASNVRMVDEMVNLMLAQRAYEASVKVVQAADEMLSLVNNLRK